MASKDTAHSGHGHVHGPGCGHDHSHQPPQPETRQQARHQARQQSHNKAGQQAGQAALAPATPLLLNESQFDPMPELTSEDKSKDELFVRMAFVADAMLKAHGKDFTMGTLVLAARFIAEGKPLIKRKQETEAADS
jgi:hypothetical protein